MTQVADLTPEHRLTLEVLRHHASMTMAPYFADMIHLMVPSVVEGDGISIDKQARLKLGTEWLDKDDGTNATRVMMAKKITHMAELLVREAHDRSAIAGSADKASLAADLEITQHHDDAITAKGDRSESSDWMYPEKFGLDKGTLETFYDQLPDPPEDYKPSLDQSDDPPEGAGDPGDGDGPGDPGDGSGDGAGSPGDDDGDGQGCKPTPGRSKAELDAARRNVADALAGSGCGDVPGDLLRWAEIYRAPPVVPWHKKLSAASSSAASKLRGHSHYSYQKMSRRQGANVGPGYPRMPRSYALEPRIDIFVDTSGSMSEHELGMALGQVEPLFKKHASKVKVWVGDTHITEAGIAGSVKEMAALLKGGGGTNFVNVFNHWATLGRKERPGTVFFFTDGGGPAPAHNPLPKCKVYWILLGPHKCVPWVDGGGGTVVEYGTIIRVPDGAPM